MHIKIPIHSAHTVTENERKLRKIVGKEETITIVSPHLDDAILSMGSMICYLVEKKKKIHVVSIFTKGSSIQTSLTRKLLKQGNYKNAKDYFQKRKREDEDAFKTIGDFKLTNLDFIDGPWRSTNNAVPLYPESTISVFHEFDRKLIKEIKEKLKLTKNATVFAPLARGRHVDHFITRTVCEKLFPQAIFYSDFPYSKLYRNEDEFIKDKNLALVEWKENYYQQKSEAIKKYVSQTKSLLTNGPMELPNEEYYLSDLALKSRAVELTQ